MSKKSIKNKSCGFSLVELIIVIVVIGILTAIITVSYVGVSKRAAGESLKSDLLAASSELMKFKADRGVYPTTIQCDIPDSSTNKCIKKSSDDVEYKYNVNTNTSPDTYGLTATKNNDNDLSYRTVTGSEPILCPVGYIVVPGSSTYSTGSFCVMKYEAKNDGGNKPVSTPAGSFWVDISQTDAISTGSKVAGCAGCHLINDAEWMTIAQNALGVPSNWRDNVVGTSINNTNYIYNGHNDAVPNNALIASADDNDGYYLTGDTAPSRQRRTLTLTNGEVIWDLAGNLCEWTSGQVSGANNQPGVVGGDYAIREWPSITLPGNLSVNSSPANTGLLDADSWNSSNGIGKTSTSTIDVSLRGTERGSWWGAGTFVGVLALEFGDAPGFSGHALGFRVAR